jgi:metallo-beta-lactamase family protein
MKIQFLGGARTVTGSMHLLEVNDQRLLLECGLYQGKRADTYDVNQKLPFDPRSIDAVILSHAHMDHSGNLPNLVKQGFNGPIFATNATVDLTDIMLRDSGHIHEWDVQYVNERRRKKNLPPVEPLYTMQDAIKTMPYFKSKWYDEQFEPVNGVTAKMVDAGHILGSAAVVLDIVENGKKTRLWYSGDVGRFDAPILRDPVFPEDVDYLLMESTYGDKPHTDLEDAFDEFTDVVNKTIKRGGKVIIPAFSVGRTQMLTYCLAERMETGLIPDIPVVVDSPLAVAASDIYRKHSECYDEETWKFISEHRHPALDFNNLIYTRTVDESKALNDFKEPMIIISASGMAESGRILHHLKNNIEDGRNTIVIISWQSPETLGRRLADGERKVRIFGEEYFRKAEVSTIGGLSAHAGQDILADYALASRKSLKKIILVHGEEKSSSALKEKLNEYEGMPDILFPGKMEVLEV